MADDKEKKPISDEYTWVWQKEFWQARTKQGNPRGAPAAGKVFVDVPEIGYGETLSIPPYQPDRPTMLEPIPTRNELVYEASNQNREYSYISYTAWRAGRSDSDDVTIAGEKFVQAKEAASQVISEGLDKARTLTREVRTGIDENSGKKLSEAERAERAYLVLEYIIINEAVMFRDTAGRYAFEVRKVSFKDVAAGDMTEWQTLKMLEHAAGTNKGKLKKAEAEYYAREIERAKKTNIKNAYATAEKELEEIAKSSDYSEKKAHLRNAVYELARAGVEVDGCTGESKDGLASDVEVQCSINKFKAQTAGKGNSPA